MSICFLELVRTAVLPIWCSALSIPLLRLFMENFISVIVIFSSKIIIHFCFYLLFPCWDIAKKIQLHSSLYFEAIDHHVSHCQWYSPLGRTQLVDPKCFVLFCLSWELTKWGINWSASFIGSLQVLNHRASLKGIPFLSFFHSVIHLL